MNRRLETDGELNWLFLPGGPGLGSESLAGLVDAVAPPGTSWLVDLPGDGSNVEPPGVGKDTFAGWPQVLLEAAEAVPNPVFVGHSTGGMYMLSTPALEAVLVGLVLISSAPDARWQSAFAAMTTENVIPEVAQATARYEAAPGNDTLGELCIAAAPWNFAEGYADDGAKLLSAMPFNDQSMRWSAENFDNTYVSGWWPRQLPTLIISGSLDRIVTQTVWDDPRFAGDHVVRRTIDGGAHFPWIEQPDAVRDAFAELPHRSIAYSGR
ncbi:MAG: alpha/beta hydrolase [Jatrophihabitantaceae bacterium]